MIRLSLGLYESPGGAQIAEWGGRAVHVLASSNEHGFEALGFEVPMPLLERFRFYDLVPGKYLVLNYGAGVVWDGRVEDRAITADGLRLTGFGFWRALADVPYTALWSVSTTAGWRVATEDDAAIRVPSKFELDSNNRLFVGLKKNAAYGVGDQGTWMLEVPHSGSRKVKSVSFRYEFLASSDFAAHLKGLNEGFGSGANEWSLTGTGSLQTGARRIELAAEKDFVAFEIRCAGATTYSGESGAHYLKITNVRVVTSLTNKIFTNLSAAITSTGSQTVTVSSTAGMYVGQKLVIGQGTSAREMVVVTAVNSSTQFSATFTNTHVISVAVEGDKITADEIVSDLISHVSGINSGQLSTSTALVSSPGIDLLDVVYEDAHPADIAAGLAGLGDNSSPPKRYEVGVYEDRRLFFRQRGSAARAWYVDLQSPEINSTLNTLVNSVYGVYQDANGRNIRTTTSTDAESVSRYGITRREAVPVRTTSATQAGVHRDTRLADGAVITPEGNIVTQRLFNQAGAQYPVWMARPGDSITARNLPPVASQEIDRIRTFTIARVDFDADANQITVVPERPLPQLEFLIARESL